MLKDTTINFLGIKHNHTQIYLQILTNTQRPDYTPHDGTSCPTWRLFIKLHLVFTILFYLKQSNKEITISPFEIFSLKQLNIYMMYLISTRYEDKKIVHHITHHIRAYTAATSYQRSCKVKVIATHQKIRPNTTNELTSDNHEAHHVFDYMHITF